MSRGGSRPRTAPQVNNTSGLLGLTFREAPTPEVCICVGEQRFSRSLATRSPRSVLREALALRREAGLPVNSLAQAMRAWQSWSSPALAAQRVRSTKR